ncbi:MAG: hypothetical protein ACTSXU_06140, partial [Promethearchaeota archaeon]
MENLDKNSVDLGNDAVKLIKDICDIAYTRLPGSDNERRAQEYIYELMKTYGAEDLEVHHFKVYSKFFRWWPAISVTLFLSSLAGYIFVPLVGLITSILALLNISFKLVSIEFLDHLFKKQNSCNVLGKIKPNKARERKKRLILILGGHADSNYEYPIGSKFGTKMVYLLISALLMMIISIIINMAHFLQTLFPPSIIGLMPLNIMDILDLSNWTNLFFFLLIFCVPYLIWLGFRMISSRPVPGANDNLSGISVIMTLLKFFSE